MTDINDILKALKELQKLSDHDFTIEFGADESCLLHRYVGKDNSRGLVNDYESFEELITDMNDIISGKNDDWLED